MKWERWSFTQEYMRNMSPHELQTLKELCIESGLKREAPLTCPHCAAKIQVATAPIDLCVKDTA